MYPEGAYHSCTLLRLLRGSPSRFSGLHLDGVHSKGGGPLQSGGALESLGGIRHPGEVGSNRGGPERTSRPCLCAGKRKEGEAVATSRTGTGKWKKLRKEAIAKALANQQYTCPRCGIALDFERSKQPNSPEADHIQEHALGGQDKMDNLRVICRRCNQQLGGKLGGKRAQQRIKTLRVAKPMKLKTSIDW